MSEIEFKPTGFDPDRDHRTRGGVVTRLAGRSAISSLVARSEHQTKSGIHNDADAFRESLTGTAPWEMDGLPVLRIETAEQFRAMASPVRDQIINVVANLTTWRKDGTAVGVSIREIGEQLGRKPASLYRHVEALVEAGLINQTGSQSSGGRDATTYAAPGAHMVLVTPAEEGPVMDAMCEYIVSVGSNAGRETAAAAVDRATSTNEIGPHDTGGAVIRGWLDEEQRAHLRRLQREMNAIFTESKRRPGTRLMAATFLFRPTRLPDGSIADEPPAFGDTSSHEAIAPESD